MACPGERDAKESAFFKALTDAERFTIDGDKLLIYSKGSDTPLRFARKGIAKDIEKVLRSAIANAQNKDGFGGDVDRLYVAACFANQGPSQKRIRPAPMGRAFRVVKRTAHLTVKVAERPAKVIVSAVPGGEEAPRPRRKGAAPKKKAAAPKSKKVGA